jgi:hypothetical protein
MMLFLCHCYVRSVHVILLYEPADEGELLSLRQLSVCVGRAYTIPLKDTFQSVACCRCIPVNAQIGIQTRSPAPMKGEALSHKL